MASPESESLDCLLRLFRHRAALSQDELADRSGVSARTISDLERGQRRSAHFETLRLLADALGLSPEDRARLIRTTQSPWIDVTLRQPPPLDAGCRALPVPATKLIGREREVVEIGEELAAEENRLITLTGPGGVGKTRLALAAAAAAAAHFAGGVAWIDLAPVGESAVVWNTIASSFGVGESTRMSPVEALRAVIGDQRFLLVLDNFEQVIEAAPSISKLLAAAPSLTVLITSRVPLNVSGEVTISVAPLPLPEPTARMRDISDSAPVQLFVERARSVRRDFALDPESSEAVVQICRRLDGLPLAIELAALRVKVLTPVQLLAWLEHPLAVLTRGARDAHPRQQTMINTIAWSYNLLDEDTRWLFRRLSVFVGGFNLDAVEWVMRPRMSRHIDAVDAIETLIDTNLVIRVPDSYDDARFTMFETIREFGIVVLNERVELQGAYDVLAGYCRGLARYGDGIPTCIVPEPWLAMVDQERNNIRAAYHHLAQAEDPEELLAFTAAFGHYLYLRGPLQEAWSWFDHALKSSVSRPTSRRLQGLYWACHLASHLGLIEQAIQSGNEALAIADELGVCGWRAAIIHCLGIIEEGSGNVDRAAALFEEELVLWKEAGVQGLSGFALMSLGSIAFRRGDLVTARALEVQAAAIFQEMSGFGWVAMTKWLRGLFAASEGCLADAVTDFCECMQLSIAHNTSMMDHRCLIGLAFVASELALTDMAGHLVGAAEASLEATGQNWGSFDRSLFERASSASRSAIGSTSFDDARRGGAASDAAAWLHSVSVIKHAAIERFGGHAADYPREQIGGHVDSRYP
jgi:predicted ATPase/DNA-binding XRE family transcriptional regulator